MEKAKDMKKKERLVSIIMATVMSGLMGLMATVLVRRGMDAQALAATSATGMYIANILESIAVGIILVLVIPFMKWGRALAARFHAVPPSIKFTALNSLPVAVGCSVLVSLIVSLINIAQAHAKIPTAVAPPFLSMWLPAWGSLLIPSIVVSYLLSMVLSPIVVRKVMGTPGGRPSVGKPEA